VNVIARLGLVLGGLFAIDAVVYWSLQHEHLGTALLAMTAVGFAFIGLYAGTSLRKARREAEPEDEEEPHVGPTIWPAVFAVSAVGLALGILVAPWLLVVGGLLFAAAGVGWTAETRRQWKHPDHDEAAVHHAQSGDES
jgi:Cytochrome c oxidase subunit IV